MFLVLLRLLRSASSSATSQNTFYPFYHQVSAVRYHACLNNNKAPCQIPAEGFPVRTITTVVTCYTFSTISQTPQGQMPAQNPQPMQRFSSTTYS